MKTCIQSATADIHFEAIDGTVCMTVTRLMKGEAGRPDTLQCITTTFNTQEAATLADVVTAMGCVAEEQAYDRDVDAVLTHLGIPHRPRDLTHTAQLVSDAAGLQDIEIPAYLKAAKS